MCFLQLIPLLHATNLPVFFSLLLIFTPYSHRGFHANQGYLTWSLPLSEFFALIQKKAFQIIMANINAILSTLEALGRDPNDPIDEETRKILEVCITEHFLFFNGFSIFSSFHFTTFSYFNFHCHHFIISFHHLFMFSVKLMFHLLFIFLSGLYV